MVPEENISPPRDSMLLPLSLASATAAAVRAHRRMIESWRPCLVGLRDAMAPERVAFIVEGDGLEHSTAGFTSKQGAVDMMLERRTLDRRAFSRIARGLLASTPGMMACVVITRELAALHAIAT